MRFRLSAVEIELLKLKCVISAAHHLPLAGQTMAAPPQNHAIGGAGVAVSD